MEVLLFRGCIDKGFELIYNAAEQDTPYIVEEYSQLESRVCASFAIYDDALDFIEIQARGYYESNS